MWVGPGVANAQSEVSYTKDPFDLCYFPSHEPLNLALPVAGNAHGSDGCF